MKRKTIQNVLGRKFNSWLASISDNNLKEKIRNNTIITGGSITSMLLGEEVTDYDIYFRTKDAAYEFAKYAVDRFKALNPDYTFKNGSRVVDIKAVVREDRISVMVKSAGVASSTKTDDYQYFETLEPGDPEQEEFIEEALKAKKREEEATEKYVPVFISSNAITLSDKIQVITRFYGEPEEIHKNFDYAHCTNYWTSWDRKLTLRSEALECILAKELKYVGSLYPLCSLFRMRKFIQRGWTINAGQILKICLQVNKLDLSDISVLEEQLIGVDVAYMAHLIVMLRKAEKENVDIDDIYICRLIDEIF